MKEEMARLLRESDGMSKEELMDLATVDKANIGIKKWALNDLIAEGVVIAVRSPPSMPGTLGDILWLEAAETPEVEEEAVPFAPTTGITPHQLRPAYVFLVKERRMKKKNVAKLFGVKRHTVRDAVKRFEETGGYSNRPGQGRPRTATDPEHLEQVVERLRINPRTTRTRTGIIGSSTRNLGRLFNISREAVRTMFKRDLHLKAYKDRERHKLTAIHRLQRILKGRSFRLRFGGGLHRLIVFTDECPFCIEQHHNVQNNRTWSLGPPSKDASAVKRTMKPSGLMVWGAIGYGFKSKLLIVRAGVKIDTEEYLPILRKFEKMAKERYGWTEEGGWAQQWTFQQDGAPSHRSRRTQQWLVDHFPDVILKGDWPAASPDINPIENIWGILKPKVNAVAHTSLRSLRVALNREWGNLPIEVINKTIDGWPDRVKRMISARGGRFES